jgi:hypothetical protein
MRKKTWFFGIFLLTVFLGIGFWVGQSVSAETNQPGSTGDPLVSKSYVDEQVTGKIAALESKIAILTTRTEALEKTIQELQARLAGQSTGGTTTPGTTTSSTGTAAPNTGTTTPSAGTTTPTAAAKIVYVKAGNTVVNLRSGPGTNHALAGKVNRGTPMTVTETAGDWYKVKLPDGKIAWVAGWLVSTTK